MSPLADKKSLLFLTSKDKVTAKDGVAPKGIASKVTTGGTLTGTGTGTGSESSGERSKQSTSAVSSSILNALPPSRTTAQNETARL